MTEIERILGLDPKRSHPWGHSWLCATHGYLCEICCVRRDQAEEIERLRKRQRGKRT